MKIDFQHISKSLLVQLYPKKCHRNVNRVKLFARALLNSYKKFDYLGHFRQRVHPLQILETQALPRVHVIFEFVECSRDLYLGSEEFILHIVHNTECHLSSVSRFTELLVRRLLVLVQQLVT